MKRLIIRGDPGVRKDGIVEVDGEEYHCFAVNRQGEWHGPDEVQLWCTVGRADEKEDFDRRNFIPMRMEVVAVDADEVTVVKAKGDLAI